MIKIIISGTADGFYPRYATDGKLDDTVSLNLLDRRRFLSREADRLDKEGYCFQFLDNTGILFHKILLLYDGFGRDGFMMASVFLPKNEILTGTEIKEALDSIVKDYKTRTINGMANFDIDWSFVKQKAGELNKKVQKVTWRKLFPNSDVSCTAFIKGADDMVADYFQYPNPLHKGLNGFGLVFLSETILDLSKESADGYQGYKVLTTADIDIANPEYQIVPIGLFKQNGSFEGEKSITKKELLKNGPIRIGTYSKPGYRTEDVYIIDEDKISKDNLTISVTLPTLIEKRTIVEITVIDTSTGNSIPNYIVYWKNVISKKLLPPKQENGKYIFSGESCDTKWSYDIDCGESYNSLSDEIDIKDGKNIQITKNINPVPLWSIDYVLPNGDIASYKQGISDVNISKWVSHAKEELKLNGYDIENEKKDIKSYKVSLYCKQHIDETFEPKKKLEESPKDNEFLGNISGASTHEEERGNYPELKRERFYLQLNSNSKDYSLFKNYRKRQWLDKKISESLQQLENQIKAWEHDFAQYNRVPERNRKKLEGRILRERKLFELFSGIIDAFKESKSEKVKSLLEQFPSDYINSGAGRDWLYKIDNTIEYVKKRNRIPNNIVISPDDITYNVEKHRLECERAETPSNTERIEFAKDRYVYSILNPVWEESGNLNMQTNVVNRRLLPKYNVMRIAIPVVAVLAIMIVLPLFFGGGDAYKSYKENISLMLNKCKELSYNEKAGETTRYVGDYQFQKLDSLRKKVRLFVNEHEKYTDSLQIDELDREYENQKNLKEQDSVCYNECKRLLDSFPHNNSLPDIENPALSKEHYEELREQYSQASKKWTADMENYKRLCLSELGTVQNIKDYFDKFGKDEDLGRHLVDIAKNILKESKERLDACNLYLTNWPQGGSYRLIGNIKDELSGRGERKTNLHTTDNKKELRRIKEDTDVTEILSKTESVQSNGEKIKLNSPGAIFKKLLWDNVKDNGKVLFETYDIDRRYTTRVDNLIKKANEVGRVKYTNAYSKVSKMTSSQIGKENKLYYLEKEFFN